VAVLAPHHAQELHAVLLGHAVVGDEHRKRLATRGKHAQRLVHAGGGGDVELVAEATREPLARHRLVVHEQDRLGVSAHGSSSSCCLFPPWHRHGAGASAGAIIWRRKGLASGHAPDTTPEYPRGGQFAR
jgi:hypothetical protein